MLSSILKITIPRNKLWTADYANLDPNAEGQVKPILYGDKKNIVPICLNISTGQFMIANHQIKSIDEIRCGIDTLVSGVDYTEDLANGKFTLSKTPLLAPSTQYYFVLSSDMTIDGANYIGFAQKPSGGYSDGQHYTIDGSDVWTGQASDLCFIAFGRSELSGADFQLVNYPGGGTREERAILWAGWNWGATFRDAAARTRIAQGFKLPSWASTNMYLSNILIYGYIVGSPDANIYVNILSAYNPSEVEVGSRSYVMTGPSGGDWNGRFPLREADESQLECDAKGKVTTASGSPLMTNVADILEDLITVECGASSAQLNATDFAALKAAKTEEIAIYINSQIEVETVTDRAESGQLFRLTTDDEGLIAPALYQSGEPAGTPHYQQAADGLSDFVSFKMIRDYNSIRQTVQVKYDEDPSAGGSSSSAIQFPYVEATSNVAKYAYGIEEMHEVETYLKDSADAQALADKLIDMFETPPLRIQFEVAYQGFDIYPASKVKITRVRAAYAGGALDGVLFRVVSIQKRVQSKTVMIDAVLDTQTY